MIRSLPFSPTLAFPTATPPRRETVRAPEAEKNPNEDPFNRMLERQRDSARLAAKHPGMSQSPAPVQPPMQTPAPEPAAGATGKEAADTAGPEQGAPGAAIRTANRTALRPADDKDKPAQLDPELPNPEARHGRKNPGTEAEVLAKLFKTPPSGLPPKLSPLEPEDPEGVAGGGTASENAPAAPGIFQPNPPVIECPVDPNCQLHASAKDADASQNPGSTQALQDQAAEALPTAPANGPAAAEAAQAALASGERLARNTAVETTSSPGATTPAGVGDTAAATAPASALASAPGSSPSSATPASRSATLEARPGSEAFAMKFSAQVAVWVREGVHEAQLQLNPADMGPVRVAIMLEGAAAQVNFTAEHVLTRQALEQALPTLAGSLAEAGFTLAGGGVFDQPQQAQRNTADETRRPADSRPALAGDEGTDAAAAATVRPRGMVDLVA